MKKGGIRSKGNFAAGLNRLKKKNDMMPAAVEKVTEVFCILQ
eukprot:CAMPEP_0195036828 /NCGR_PEP_ID=MMETSP0326_2-20130528/73478_1 /TAXON_ID=2866 ORGANISM="Crypthecodinium cohnii, Strain Seligo" /NCGR_SAMPLE_ID=MMETSP0326_2 /ASSEMBLY_ACC=CAM_ASM_000348 /LENGTH=41 /DNA_ID= /DNA_START= /DNA_END= /DNA_ORIENTATION=